MSQKNFLNIEKSILTLLLLSLNEKELFDFFDLLSDNNFINNKIIEIIVKQKKLQKIFFSNKKYLNSFLLYNNHYYYENEGLFNFLFDKKFLTKKKIFELFEWKNSIKNYEPIIKLDKNIKFEIDELKIENFYYYYYYDKEVLENFFLKKEEKIFNKINDSFKKIEKHELVNIGVENEIFFYFYVILQENFYKLNATIQDKIVSRISYFFQKIIYLFIESELLLYNKIKKLFFYIFSYYTNSYIKEKIKEIFIAEIDKIVNNEHRNLLLLEKLKELIEIYYELGELKDEKDTNIIFEKLKENQDLIYYQECYLILDVNELMRTIEDLIFFELTYTDDEDISEEELKENLLIFKIINNILTYIYYNPPKYYYINKKNKLIEFYEQLNSNLNIIIEKPNKLFNEVKFIIYKYHIKYYIKYDFKDESLLQQFKKILNLFNKETLFKLNYLIFNDYMEYLYLILEEEELKNKISNFFYTYTDMENLFLLTKLYTIPEYKEYINELIKISEKKNYMNNNELKYYITLIYLKNPFINTKELKEMLLNEEIKENLKKFLLKNNSEIDLFLLKLIKKEYLKEIIENKKLLEKLLL